MGTGKTSGKYITFLLYLVLVVLVNAAAVTFFFRTDLTANGLYSLSRASRDVVSSLSEPLTINVFFTKNLPAPHNSTERYLRDLLEEYAMHANRHFNFRFYNVSAEEGDLSERTRRNQELARNYGVYPVQIRAIEKDEMTFQNAYMGLAAIHGDLVEKIPTITSTEDLEYTLTQMMRKLTNKISVLLGLDEKVRVKLFLSPALEGVAPYLGVRGLKGLPQTLKEVVGRVNKKNYDALVFERVTPSGGEGMEEMMREYGILTLSWPAVKGKVEEGEGSIGLVMTYKDRWFSIPLLRVLRLPLIGTRYELIDMNRLEEVVSENLESLVQINEDLAYLADHGTPEMSNPATGGMRGNPAGKTLTTFPELLSRAYALKPVRLKEEPLPDHYTSLLIAGPTEALSDYELFQIDQFLMRGKNLAVFLDAFDETAPQGPQGIAMGGVPSFTPRDTGIEKLLAHYGIHLKRSFVLDERCVRQPLPVAMGGGERPVYFAPLITPSSIDQEMAFMRNIKQMVALKVSPLEVDAGRMEEAGLKAYPLVSSSEKSWEMKEQITFNPMFQRPPGPDGYSGPMPLAYVVEGPFPSYFAGKPLPEKPASGGKDEGDEEKDTGKEGTGDDASPAMDLSRVGREGDVLQKGRPARIFIMGSSEMIGDSMLDREGKSSNAMFILNVMDYLNEREDLAEMRSKTLQLNPLHETGPGVKTVIKTFNIAGLPLLVALFGITVWLRRRSRKRYIRLMFQK